MSTSSNVSVSSLVWAGTCSGRWKELDVLDSGGWNVRLSREARGGREESCAMPLMTGLRAEMSKERR